MEVEAKKFGNSWFICGKNIKGFSVGFNGPIRAILCNIRKDHLVGSYIEDLIGGFDRKDIVID